MSEKKYRNHSAESKIAIVRRHLIDHVAVSDLCEEYQIYPSLFYKWQKEIFEAALRGYSTNQLPKEMSKDKSRIKQLENKLAEKNEILAELMREYVLLKKEYGEI
jgi:transposase